MPDMMSYIFKYFWFIGAIVGLINTSISWLRINPVLIKKPELRADAQKLFFGLFFILVLPFIVLGILQLLGGFNNMFYIFSRDFNNLYLISSWASLALTYFIVLYWFFFKDAVRIVIIFREYIGRFPDNEAQIKALVILMICSGVIAVIVGINQDGYTLMNLIK